MWQTKYASAIPNLQVGVDFWLCNEGYFLTGFRSRCFFVAVIALYVNSFYWA